MIINKILLIGENKFQVSMMDTLSCPGGSNGCSKLIIIKYIFFNDSNFYNNIYDIVWWCGQFIPFTMCCAQYFLRKKVLNDDMTKYSCCQVDMNYIAVIIWWYANVN